MGKHALASCLTKHLHPTKAIRQKCPLVGKNRAMNGLSVVHEEAKKASRAVQRCAALTHPKWPATAASIAALSMAATTTDINQSALKRLGQCAGGLTEHLPSSSPPQKPT
jgi:hypothetical protein